MPAPNRHPGRRGAVNWAKHPNILELPGFQFDLNENGGIVSHRDRGMLAMLFHKNFREPSREGMIGVAGRLQRLFQACLAVVRSGNDVPLLSEPFWNNVFEKLLAENPDQLSLNMDKNKKWDVSGPLDGISKSGVAFYRTTFDLKIPDSVDYPISLQLPTIASNSSPYRAVIYVNGYQFGRYASTLGPQTRFPIPPEVLNRKGKNTLAIALWAMGKDGAALSSLTLQVDAKLEYGGPKLGKEPAPSFKAKDRSLAS